MRVLYIVTAAAIVAAAFPVSALAADEHAGGHESGHGSHPHHVSLTVGAADNKHLHETGLSVGAEYRYSLNDRFGIGPMVDFTTYDHEKTTLLVGALYWRPWAGQFQVFGGPGIEWVDAEHHDESRFAFRVGAGYELHVGRLSLTPLVNLDQADGHSTWVYALAFGMGF